MIKATIPELDKACELLNIRPSKALEVYKFLFDYGYLEGDEWRFITVNEMKRIPMLDEDSRVVLWFAQELNPLDIMETS